MEHLSDEVLSAYIEGDLTAAESGEVAEHIAGCPRCREAVADIRVLRDEARALPLREPSPELWQRISARVSQRRGAVRWYWFGVPALAAAVLLAFVMGLRLGNFAKTRLIAGKPARSEFVAAAQVQRDYQDYVRGIEAAIRECEAALQENPGHPRVRAAYVGAQSGRNLTMDRLAADGD